MLSIRHTLVIIGFVFSNLLLSAPPNKADLLANLPLTFEENRGQWDQQVLFAASGKDGRIFITRAGVVLDSGSGDQRSALRISVVGGDAAATATGERPLGSTSNYFRGADRKTWVTDVSRFQAVRVKGVQAGLDIVYYGNNGKLEYDVVLHPGFEPRPVRLRYEGGGKLTLDKAGSLVVQIPTGKLVQTEPFVWQVIRGEKTRVKSKYRLESDNTLAIDLGEYNKEEEVTIDPILTFSTYLGGRSDDVVTGVAVDYAGYIYLTGYTQSIDFPVSIGAYRLALNGTASDAFVTKMNPTGTTVLYSTLIGGGSSDTPVGIAVDSSGNAVITGTTLSADFPTTANVLAPTKTTAAMFVAKISPSGSSLVYSTYLGQNTLDASTGIAIDASGSAYITGYTYGTAAFDVAAGTVFSQFGGTQSSNAAHIFIAKVSSSGDRLNYLIYLNSATGSIGRAITLDSTNQAYVTGTTPDSDFPITPNALQSMKYPASPYGYDGFVTCINSSGTGLVFSTFLGSVTNGSSPTGIAVDAGHNAYVVGLAWGDFPITAGAFMAGSGSSGDRYDFVAKLNSTGSALTYSTFIAPASYYDSAGKIAVDASGAATIAGVTDFPQTFPITANAFPNQLAAGPTFYPAGYVFVTKLNPQGSGLIFSSFLGSPVTSPAILTSGQINAFVGGVAVDSSGNPIIAGSTISAIFPITPGAFQTNNPDSTSQLVYGTGFIMKVDLSSPLICSYALSVIAIQAPVAGTSGIVNVTTSPGCPWVALVSSQYTQAPKISVGNPSGVGNGTFTYSIGSSSQATQALTGSIQVGNATIAITQPSGACSNPIIFSATHAFSAAGGSGRVSVQIGSGCSYAVTSSASWTGFSSMVLSGPDTFFYVEANAASDRSAILTIAGQPLYVSQYGTGTPSPGYTKVGVMQISSALWATDSNGSGGFDSGDRVFPFLASPGDIAVVGDWTGDGHAKAGIYRNGFWALDLNNNGIWDGPSGGDSFIALGGQAGDIPFVGDWNGDGRTKVGIYRHGFWLLDTNGNGVFDAGDQVIAFGGNPGEQPVIGDWNGDGRTKVGFLYNGTWTLDYNGNGVADAADKQYSFPYAPGDKAVVGDWNGTHTAKIGIYRAGFWILDFNGNGMWDGIAGGDRFSGFGGNVGEIPVVGDWNGSGTIKIGFYYRGYWCLDYNGNGQFDGTGVGQDRFFGFGGATGEQPVVGPW